MRLIYINHYIATRNVQTHIFLTIYVSFKRIHHTETIYSTQDSKINLQMSAFPYIPVRSAKAYVNQFLALPNAIFSHNVYLYECV